MKLPSSATRTVKLCLSIITTLQSAASAPAYITACWYRTCSPLSPRARRREHIEILSCRTIREKLLAYFTLLSAHAGNERFDLPFSFASLAEYLCVDRSAMMRELKKLKDDGLVKTDRRHIELNIKAAAA